MLDKPRRIPLRYQIRRYILDFLKRNNYQTGDKIPTEAELADMLNVSRSSLREGLHLLEEERVIRAKHGAGRFLLAYDTDLALEITRLQSVSEMLAANNLTGQVKVTRAEVVPADREVASHLDLELAEPVLWIERMRLVNDNPIIYSVDILPERCINFHWEPEDFAGSLLDVLETQAGIYLDYSEASIISVSKFESGIEEDAMERLAPWVLLLQVNYTRLGEPMVFSKDYHSSKYISFRVRRTRF